MADSADRSDSAYVPFPAFADWAPTFDSSTIDQFAFLLRADREAVDDSALEAAVKIATRYAAVDTGAIEGLYTVDRGFTRTIATEAAAWEAALKSHGEDVARSIEDALKAYEYVLDIVTAHDEITESWIRQLHEIVTASQESYTVYTPVGPQLQPLPKGVYKSMPNSPTSVTTGRVHHYANPADTPAEMARLIAELRSSEFGVAHPVLQSAYAHYAFVCIHPFADGNGRVSRLLASIFLYRSPGVPLVVFADQKDLYIDALEAADAGDPRPFVSFIEQRSIDTIDIVRLHLRTADAPSTAASLDALTRDLSGRGGLTHTEFDAIASRLRDLIRDEFERIGSTLPLPDETRFYTGPSNAQQSPPAGFRATSHGVLGVWLRLSISSTVTLDHDDSVFVWPARLDGSGADFTVTDAARVAPLDIYVRDVSPVETEVLRLKIAGWVEHRVNAMVDEFSNKVRNDLVAKGYISPSDG